METACFSDSRTGTLVPLGTSGSGVGNIPSATASGLEEGTSYEFRACAHVPLQETQRDGENGEHAVCYICKLPQRPRHARRDGEMTIASQGHRCVAVRCLRPAKEESGPPSPQERAARACVGEHAVGVAQVLGVPHAFAARRLVETPASLSERRDEHSL